MQNENLIISTKNMVNKLVDKEEIKNIMSYRQMNINNLNAEH